MQSSFGSGEDSPIDGVVLCGAVNAFIPFGVLVVLFLYPGGAFCHFPSLLNLPSTKSE